MQYGKKTGICHGRGANGILTKSTHKLRIVSYMYVKGHYAGVTQIWFN